MNAKDLAALLLETERAHAASGHSAADWADWYAHYILQHYSIEKTYAEAPNALDKPL